MGNIVRLAKTDPFFEQIRQRLEDDVNGDPANGILPDIQLQN